MPWICVVENWVWSMLQHICPSDTGINMCGFISSLSLGIYLGTESPLWLKCLHCSAWWLVKELLLLQPILNLWEIQVIQMGIHRWQSIFRKKNGGRIWSWETGYFYSAMWIRNGWSKESEQGGHHSLRSGHSILATVPAGSVRCSA